MKRPAEQVVRAFALKRTFQQGMCLLYVGGQGGMYCLSWNMLSPVERPTRNTIGLLANGVKHFFLLTATIWTSDVFQQERAVALLCYRHLMSIAL